VSGGLKSEPRTLAGLPGKFGVRSTTASGPEGTALVYPLKYKEKIETILGRHKY